MVTFGPEYSQSHTTIFCCWLVLPILWLTAQRVICWNTHYTTGTAHLHLFWCLCVIRYDGLQSRREGSILMLSAVIHVSCHSLPEPSQRLDLTSASMRGCLKAWMSLIGPVLWPTVKAVSLCVCVYLIKCHPRCHHILSRNVAFCLVCLWIPCWKDIFSLPLSYHLIGKDG